MRAKACVRCRQWKVGCDADVEGANGCTRCRNLGLTCTFNSNFRRTPKRRRLIELQNEVAHLKELNSALSRGNSIDTDIVTLPSVTTAWLNESECAATIPANGDQDESLQHTTPSLQGYSTFDKSIGDVHLTATQVNELFRIYFTRCHPYLPFKMHRSPDQVYEKCPLLFWTICATASADIPRMQFEDPVRNQICRILDPSLSTVEVVQALLILCMWPFAFVSQKSDPSFIYGGIATQIALQIGLHRPAIDYPLNSDSGSGNEDEEIRSTTWIACFIVNQILASRLGVPSAILADHSLLTSLENPAVPTQLSRLCAISHLTVESSQAIGARASNGSGLADPVPRISLINVFARQFDELRKKSLSQPSDIEEIFFLSSMLQLWSFALHDDVPVSSESFHIVQRAREDAIRLIQLAREKNLSLVPFYICRSVCYAALLLYHIKLSPYAVRDELLDDHIMRAQEALRLLKSPNLPQFLATVTSPENRQEFIARRDKNSSHRWKMGASLVFDSARAYSNLLRSNVYFCPEFLDLDGFLFDGSTSFVS
jgi:hypothetical protein